MPKVSSWFTLVNLIYNKISDSNRTTPDEEDARWMFLHLKSTKKSKISMGFVQNNVWISSLLKKTRFYIEKHAFFQYVEENYLLTYARKPLYILELKWDFNPSKHESPTFISSEMGFELSNNIYG